MNGFKTILLIKMDFDFMFIQSDCLFFLFD